MREAVSESASASIARVTLQDVADRAGVSITTASRVVNETPARSATSCSVTLAILSDTLSDSASRGG